MNISYLESQEKQTIKGINKLSRRAVAVCTLACVLMWVLQFVCSFVAVGLNIDINDEIVMSVANIAMYVISLVVPFSISYLVFKALFKNTDKYIFSTDTIKVPLLYIFGAVGTGYLTNLLISVIFPKFVEFYNTGSDNIPTTTLGVILLYVSTAVLPAILEEWAFRGIICKNLLPYGKKGAIVVSSLLFAVMHIDPPRIVFAFIFGIILAVCYEATGSLAFTMTIHFLNNALSVTSAVFVSDDADDIFSVLFSFIILAILISGIVFLIYYCRKGVTDKKVSWKNPSNMGYTLSAGKFLFNLIINVGIIPLILVYAFFYYLSFIVN